MRAPRLLCALAGLAACFALSASTGDGNRDKRARVHALIEADAALGRNARADALPAPARAHLTCLALAVYHEARGELPAGRYAVALVVRNRSMERLQSFCDVVWAPHQFSFTAFPAKRLVPADARAWRDALLVACAVALDGFPDITGGSNHFSDPKRASPAWARRASRARQIGAHRFLHLAGGRRLFLLPVRSFDTWT